MDPPGDGEGVKGMILYHGSKGIVEYPVIRKSRFHMDFYFGFYCTPCFEQARRRAARYGCQGYVNRYDYTSDNSLNYLYFAEMTDEWLDFVSDCRNGKSHRYDIVEGPMADDTIFNHLQNYLDGKISRAAFWELAKSKHPASQISFHSISALNTLCFAGSETAH